MTYNTLQKTVAAGWVIFYLPRMRFGVARTWVIAEQGLNNNVFGITNSNGSLKTYPTVRQGVKAMADLIKTSPLYAGIRATLYKGATGNIQATSICRSPWHLGVAGLKKAGGLDPYYARIFRGRGYIIS
jgi:hypothetical protein